VTDGPHPGQVIERWNGTKWSLFPGPKFAEQVGIWREGARAMTAASFNGRFNGGLLNAGRFTEVFRPTCSFRNSELLLRRVPEMDCALFMVNVLARK
jgi:hypothetical protein